MALVQFCGDESDLDDAELWAVIDSAAASHSVQKQQPRNKASYFSPHSHHKTNSKNACGPVVTELPPSPCTDICPYPRPIPISSSRTIPQRAQKNQKRFQVEEDSRFSPSGEVVQRPWTTPPPQKLARYENSNNITNDSRRHQQNNNNNNNYACIVKPPQLQQSSSSSLPPSSFKNHPIQELGCRDIIDLKANVPVPAPAPAPANNFWNSSSTIPSMATFKNYQNTAMSILEKTDYISMQGKPFIKKSGWRKIAFFFNISFEIKDKTIQLDQNSNVLRAEFVIRASMQGGRFSDSWGSCDRGEKRFSKPNHDIPSTAETRAKTRACQ
ncbi:hypothetical protein KI387_005768, partial [Taxus chinensis]